MEKGQGSQWGPCTDAWVIPGGGSGPARRCRRKGRRHADGALNRINPVTSDAMGGSGREGERKHLVVSVGKFKNILKKPKASIFNFCEHWKEKSL